MPHFTLMTQSSLQVVEDMEKHPASLEESLTGASAFQETCRPVVWSVHICLRCCAQSWRRLCWWALGAVT